ncbi:MAG TPA: DUF4886 domain-containing protein [Thermoguttaceae bacterium]|nr:DUF4886 domain-containing protein [Thermoguttaceae bacterium]
MNRALLALVALVVLSACIRTSSAEEEPLRVLFIGNSYTYCNDLPGMIAGLAEAAGARKIEVHSSVSGGCTLERHFTQENAVEKIRGQKWDAVVLQEQSTRPVLEPNTMHEFARKLHAEIQEQGAETVFFLTWARQHKPEMQDALNDAYFGIAGQLGATVAPVGVAWKNALAADAGLVLHAKDQSHPNPAGSYLAACVFYATLLEKSPVGLPAEIKRNGKVLSKLDPGLAARLQAIAWKTVQNAASAEDSSENPVDVR